MDDDTVVDGPFAEVLDALIAASGKSIRQLSKELAEQTGAPPEAWRRNLTRYLAGGTRPHRRTLVEIERALGVPAGQLAVGKTAGGADRVTLASIDAKLDALLNIVTGSDEGGGGRSDAARQIEVAATLLGDLAVLVAEQGSRLDRIEAALQGTTGSPRKRA